LGFKSEVGWCDEGAELSPTQKEKAASELGQGRTYPDRRVEAVTCAKQRIYQIETKITALKREEKREMSEQTRVR